MTISAAQLEQLKLLDQATDKAVKAGLLTPERAEEQKAQRRAELEGTAPKTAPAAETTAASTALLQESAEPEAHLADNQVAHETSFGKPAIVQPPQNAAMTGLMQAAVQKAALQGLGAGAAKSEVAQPAPRGGSIAVRQAPRAQVAPDKTLLQQAEAALAKIGTALTVPAEFAIVAILEKEGYPPLLALAIAQGIPATVAALNAASGEGTTEEAEMSAVEEAARLAEAAKFGQSK